MDSGVRRQASGSMRRFQAHPDFELDDAALERLRVTLDVLAEQHCVFAAAGVEGGLPERLEVAAAFLVELAAALEPGDWHIAVRYQAPCLLAQCRDGVKG